MFLDDSEVTACGVCWGCADEITTGLDSATAKDVIGIIRAMVDKLNITAVVALLQPPPEVFSLFDRVLLMREGSIVYHGASAQI